MAAIKSFNNQDYEKLLKAHSETNLFVDPYFPAEEISLFYSRPPPNGVVWKRPKQITKNAQFVIDGFSRTDFSQGQIGNCWFIAGCVGILQSKTLFSKVVPEKQSFSQNYAGIFHFRFWLYGKWVSVVVDDRLPCFSDGRLVFASNKIQPNEFWAVGFSFVLVFNLKNS